MRKVGLILLRLLLILGLLHLAYLVGGWGLGALPVNTDFEPTPNGVPIYVWSNGVHTDIIVPAAQGSTSWRETIPFDIFQSDTSQVAWVAFGWGDRGLYENVPTWADLTFPIGFRSMMIPTQSALHVTLYDEVPTAGEWIIPLDISEAQYADLVTFIEQSFERDENGRLIDMACCWYAGINDNFFVSHDSYHLLRTCNNWTNKALQVAGIRTGVWSPFHESLKWQLEQIDTQ